MPSAYPRVVPLRIRHVARDFYVPRGTASRERAGLLWFSWRTSARLTNGPHW